MRTARTKFDADLKAILTADQAKKYDEMQAAARPRRPGT
jgi:Spy/CpxP family protein refolding chaperone